MNDVGERALLATIQNLTARGITVILITHRTASLEAVQKIMVLGEGTIRAYGPRTEILAALRARVASQESVSVARALQPQKRVEPYCPTASQEVPADA